MTALMTVGGPAIASTRPGKRVTPSRVLYGAAWVLAVLAVGMLCVADLFPQDLTDTSEPYVTLAAATFVIQTLQPHIAVLCSCCLAAALIGGRRPLAVVSAMGTALGFGPTLLALLATPAPAQVGTSLRLMSMNLFARNGSPEMVLERVAKSSPDVVLFQEYSPMLEDALRPTLMADYPYQLRRPSDDPNGWAVYSRRPLVAPIDTGLRLNGSSRQARFGVRIGSRDVVVYALHLTCPKSVDRIGENRAEVAELASMIAKEDRPVILAGDFNFTARTANANALRAAGLRSTHDLAGRGVGNTWHHDAMRGAIPGFRIDHVFVSSELTCTNADVLEPAGSDHLPIIADIALAEIERPTEAVASAD